MCEENNDDERTSRRKKKRDGMHNSHKKGQTEMALASETFSTVSMVPFPTL